MAAYYNEFDPYAAQWLTNLVEAGHIARGQVDSRSILEVTRESVGAATQAHFFAGIGVWSHALRLAGWPDDRPVWTGSCPCQPFSVAGRRKGTDDERHLWPEWRRLIAECLPPVVFGEQVASADGRAWFDAVRADLEALGYAVGAADLCAAGVGAPHIRQRLYFGAVRLADADATGRGLVGRGGLPEVGHAPLRHDAGGRGAARGLGDTGGARAGRDAGAGPRAQEGTAVRAVGDASLAPGPIRGLGDDDDEGLEGHAGHGQDGHQPGRDAAQPHGPTPTSGFWSDPDWVLCRDKPVNKWRPVEPGTFPLAHGAPARVGPDGSMETQPRVGKLRAYGNAIVSEVAATFVRSMMDVLDTGLKSN
jgi:DNA (cytosine-5)-methyltransferase 1